MGHRDTSLWPKLILGNHRSVHLTRSVCRRAALFKRGSGKIWRQRAKVTSTHNTLIAEVGTSSQDFRHKIGQRVKSSRSRYVPVRRNFAVFCVFGVSKNQFNQNLS